MNDENRLRPLHEALDDHSAEGIALLTAEPSRLTMLTIVATAALVLCALLWSFIGHADVIVTAHGTLAPESEVRRFYAPVDGELADRSRQPPRRWKRNSSSRIPSGNGGSSPSARR